MTPNSFAKQIFCLKLLMANRLKLQNEMVSTSVGSDDNKTTATNDDLYV